jgi:hypothetical protein
MVNQADRSPDLLSDEDIAILADYFLPSDRLIWFSDHLKSGFFAHYNGLRRAEERGFPPGTFLAPKRRVWTPRSVAAYLRALPHEPPAVLTELRKRGGRVGGRSNTGRLRRETSGLETEGA